MTLAELDPATFSLIHIDAATSPRLEGIAEFAAAWGIGLFPAVLCILWLTGDPKARGAAVAAALSSTLASMTAGVLSFLVYVPRPFAQGLAENVLRHAADSSFPSDHATVLAAATVTLALRGYPLSAILLGFATLAVGWARVALGVHFPSDVVGGLAIGVCIALVFRTPVFVGFAEFVEQVGELVAGPVRLDAIAARLRPTPPKEH